MWEYRVVRWPSGRYTESLNAYALEGWELVEVVRDDPPPSPAPSRTLPVPGALGKLGAAADTLGASKDEPTAEPTTLLWVLRRPAQEP